MKAIHERQKSLEPLALERLLLDNDDPLLLADLKQEEEKPVLGCRSGRYLAGVQLLESARILPSSISA